MLKFGQDILSIGQTGRVRVPLGDQAQEKLPPTPTQNSELRDVGGGGWGVLNLSLQTQCNVLAAFNLSRQQQHHQDIRTPTGKVMIKVYSEFEVAVFSTLAKWGQMSPLLAYLFYLRQAIPYTPSLFQGVSFSLLLLFPITMASIEQVGQKWGQLSPFSQGIKHSYEFENLINGLDMQLQKSCLPPCQTMSVKFNEMNHLVTRLDNSKVYF